MGPLPSWLLESWVEYGISMAVIVVRIFARIRPEWLNGWHGDDYLIIVTAACISALLYALQSMYDVNKSAGSPDIVVGDLSTSQQESKYGFLAWATYITAIWSLKGCMLYYFSRLDLAATQRRFLKLCAWFVFLTYIGVWICGLLKCLPGKGSSNPQPGVVPGFCPPGVENFYVVGITNLLTDALIFSIPIPLLWRSHLTVKRLFLIGCMFALGIFVMAADCLRNILGLITVYSSGGNQGYIIIWAVREILAAILVVNIPCIKSLFSSSSWLHPIPPSPTPTDPEKGIRNSTSNLSLSCRGSPEGKKRRSTSSSSSTISAAFITAASLMAETSGDTSPETLSRCNSMRRPSSMGSRSRSHSRKRSADKASHTIPLFNLKVSSLYTSEAEGERSASSSRTDVADPVGMAMTTDSRNGCANILEKGGPLVITKHTELEVHESSPNNLNGVEIEAASKKRTSEGMRRSWGWRW